MQTSRHWSKPQPPRPTLKFDPEGRPPVRFRRNVFSPLSPTKKKDDIHWDAKSALGLGIAETPFRPDASPVTPGTVEEAVENRSGASPAALNFAQRIEQKLWKYNASSNVVKRWLPEIISWSVSAACMAGIAIVLFVYRNKRLPKWPLGITLNAYISVLAKIASAGLLLPVSEALGQLKWSWFSKENSKKMWDFEIFDSASRGAWGSLLLLVRTKGKSLAALGAGVTILALALDPFFQKVAEYPEHWRLQPETGTIPSAIGYTPYGAGLEFRRDTGQNLGLDQAILSVTNRFFFNNGTTPLSFGKGVRAEVPVSCPNSNCTWAQYETLGVCSECMDVSDLIEFKCINKALDWVQVPDKNPKTDESIFPNGTSCGWWLKADEPLLMTGYNVDRNTAHSGETLLMRAQPLYDIFTRALLTGYSAKLNHTRNPLSHAVIVSGENVSNIYRNGTPIAHECMISWCIKEILSEYSEGGYTETVKNTYSNNTIGPEPWITFPVYDEKNKTLGINYIYGENATLISPTGHTYQIDNLTHVMTLSVFDDAFPSTYTLINSTSEADAMLRFKQYYTQNPWTRKETYNPFMFANISTHLNHLATALTNVIRSSDDHTEMIRGSAFEMESFVEVQWAWLSLPLALLALTCLFLVATIIRSSMEQESFGVYKTSAIATLLFGLPDEMQKKIMSSKEKGTPRANAKETKVKWVPKAGWRFSGHTLSPTSTKSRDSPSAQWR